jgi:pyrroloquinoline quinone biosynthesis protein E
MLIDPAGYAMPCHSARVIPGLEFPNAAEQGLRSIWDSADVFQRFRGDHWMQEPCRSCERKTVDYGGCRCQAMLLTGDAAATDPVCSLSSERAKVDRIIARTQEQATGAVEWVYRIDPVALPPPL